MFFLLSSFRFCPPLKNDGRSELRFDVVLNDFLAKKKRIQNASRQKSKLEQTYKKYFFMTAENGLPVKYNKGKKEFIFHSFI